MTQAPEHFEVTTAIDRHLSRDSFDAISLTSDNRYQPWYATLLSSIALLAADEEVVFAYSSHETGMSDARVVVFTTHLILIAEIDPDLDGVPVVQAVRRSSLITMKLSSSERIDARERRSHEWPGMLNLVLMYKGLPESIEIVQHGANRYSVKEPSAIVALLKGLSADLANSGATD